MQEKIDTTMLKWEKSVKELQRLIQLYFSDCSSIPATDICPRLSTSTTQLHISANTLRPQCCIVLYDLYYFVLDILTLLWLMRLRTVNPEQPSNYITLNAEGMLKFVQPSSTCEHDIWINWNCFIMNYALLHHFICSNNVDPLTVTKGFASYRTQTNLRNFSS